MIAIMTGHIWIGTIHMVRQFPEPVEEMALPGE